ncbi:MAG: GNAT family N-acetyltransferase [Leptolyngbyaceae bacterium]|nr:GNAT family N-acetyltransferase [Leptolyngbyaceae bacterium]
MSLTSERATITVRPCQYGDLENVESLIERSGSSFETQSCGYSLSRIAHDLMNIRQWYALIKLLSWFPNPLQHFFSAYVAELAGKFCGFIQVTPCNSTRSTWRIERITTGASSELTGFQNGGNGGSGHAAHVGDGQSTSAAVASDSGLETLFPNVLAPDVASHLLRYCLDNIWEARTWMVEVSINDKSGIGLYRQNGFQPLAQVTYWVIAPDLLSALAEHDPSLDNLRSVNNADASLLHQLDTVSMPPLVRQVFDRHVSDFKAGLASSTVDAVRHLVQRQEIQQAYVFEPQRKAAIGYFYLEISQTKLTPHRAQLTVHPAYTYLYPKLLAHMARLLRAYPTQSLQIASSDYQPEREEYLSKIGADRMEHTLMMSRSVWHKVRETKPASLEGLQLAEVLQGLKPSRKPIPGRFSWTSLPSEPIDLDSVRRCSPTEDDEFKSSPGQE